MNACLDAALEYREAGLHVVALRPRSKAPLVPWKQYQDTMPTEEEIRGWFAVCPDANIALIMGRGTFAVDVDGPEGEQALAGAGINLSFYPRSRTSRGYHVFLSGQEIPDRIGIFPKVDVRGVGYVVAPPSVHESGHVYTWERPIEGALPLAPERLFDLIRRPLASTTPGLGGTDWFTQALIGVAEGGRDQTCTRIAGYLLGKGIPQDAVELILQAWAEKCSPPFPSDQVSKCVESIAKREGVPDEPPSQLADLVAAEMLVIHDPEMRKKAITTSIEGLDELLANGFQPGEYIILGARPSVGKTAFALQIARRLGERGQETLVVSLEMGKPQLVRRMLAQECKVDAKALRTGELDVIQLAALEDGAPRLAKMPIRITTDVRTPTQLEALLAVYDPGLLKLVVIDYIQLLSTEGTQFDSRQRVGSITREIRRLANKYEVAILALSQLTRPTKDRGYEPGIESLMESGELEAGADIVLLMSRGLEDPVTKLRVGKNRDGNVGDITLKFLPRILTFEETK
jgi:KaiC/GvpD/RAD55 family RecA-like ATPase